MKIHLKKKMIKKIKSDLIHTKISMNKEIKMKREKKATWKTRRCFIEFNFYSETESDPSGGEYTHNLSKHHNLYDDMESFNNRTVGFLQDLHFHTNVLKYFLGCIPSFYVKIYGKKTNVDNTPSDSLWDFSTSVPFLTLITYRQYLLPLRHMAKK